MTQQKIHFINSSNKIKDDFISHIKKAIFSDGTFSEECDLESLHDSYTYKDKLLEKGTDQSTLFHKNIYSSFDHPDFLSTNFWKSYKTLCLNILEKLKNETEYYGDWAIQRFPTFRFQFL